MPPTEQQLKNREIVAAGGVPPAGAVDTTAFTGNDTFLKTLQNKILGSADIISSEDTNIEKAFEDIRGGITTAQEKETERITSQFGREIEFQRGEFAQTRTSAIESQRGFATNTAALQALDVRTEKSLRDLEQRKQELILSGEIAASKEISQLMFDELKFKQDSQQKAFSNILNASREIRAINSEKFDIAEKAAEAGASESEIAAIMNAGSAGAALQIASPFLKVEEEGELRTVPGVGVVRVFKDNTFKTIVPEVDTKATKGTLTTSFGDTIRVSPSDANKIERNNLQIFAPDFQLQILRELKDQEISAFMLDYLEAARTLEKRGQSISPGVFFEQWKLENDIDDGGDFF